MMLLMTVEGEEKSDNTLSPLLSILESLLSNSIHCWTTRLTLGSELLTSWKPVMFAPPFLRSVRSMSRKPWERKRTHRRWDTQAGREPADVPILETETGGSSIPRRVRAATKPVIGSWSHRTTMLWRLVRSSVRAKVQDMHLYDRIFLFSLIHLIILWCSVLVPGPRQAQTTADERRRTFVFQVHLISCEFVDV